MGDYGFTEIAQSQINRDHFSKAIDIMIYSYEVDRQVGRQAGRQKVHKVNYQSISLEIIEMFDRSIDYKSIVRTTNCQLDDQVHLIVEEIDG